MNEMVGASWRKSTRCETSACVEVAMGGGVIGLRNSNLPEVRLTIEATVWQRFIAGVRIGEFDRNA